MREIRRILVALEPALMQSQLPELAARIAAEASSEIEALLVQDTALMVAADLPFTQEVLVATGARRGLTRDALDLDFEALASRFRLRFERSAGRDGVPWRLRSVRGDPIAQIIAAAAQSDLLILGMPRGSEPGIGAMRQIAEQAGRPAMFLGDLASPTSGVSVLDGETELARGLPAMAGVFARVFPGPLSICHEATAADVH